MKKIISLWAAFLMLVSLGACGDKAFSPIAAVSRGAQLNIANSVPCTGIDDHGGGGGDGRTVATLTLDDGQYSDILSQVEQSEAWKEFPLSDTLHLAMFGGMKDGMEYGYNFASMMGDPTITTTNGAEHYDYAKMQGMPQIKNGYWFFVDRYSEATDKTDDSPLLDRASFNFTFAALDCDTQILYYFEYDT